MYVNATFTFKTGLIEPLRHMRKKTDTSASKPRKKKGFGQHFLRKQSVVDHMIEKIAISDTTSILEIGCGDGFLTRSILEKTPCVRLWSYEIDPEWADYVKERITDARLSVKEENILEVDMQELEAHAPWVLLSNLPFQITFPILFLLYNHKKLFSEGVIMIQEEVAQKITAKRGKKYSATSLFLQHHFDFELMEKIEPGAFSPPPKVFSRLIYFKPKYPDPLPDEEGFWKFLKLCFGSPRQMLKNNLQSTHFDLTKLPDELAIKRAQELSFEELLVLWESLKTS